MVRKKKRANNPRKNIALTAKEIESSSSPNKISESHTSKMETMNEIKMKQEEDLDADEEKLKQPITIIKNDIRFEDLQTFFQKYNLEMPIQTFIRNFEKDNEIYPPLEEARKLAKEITEQYYKINKIIYDKIFQEADFKVGDLVMVLLNLTEKFRGVVAESREMANRNRTWGREPRLAGESLDSSSCREDAVPDEGIDSTNASIYSVIILPLKSLPRHLVYLKL
ncbi:hypothetical protein TNCV_2414111 [Trichonephila clavipes]|nr:hypothetical protein TNCV_2414111 [Trichonephila clavipes]